MIFDGRLFISLDSTRPYAQNKENQEEEKRERKREKYRMSQLSLLFFLFFSFSPFSRSFQLWLCSVYLDCGEIYRRCREPIHGAGIYSTSAAPALLLRDEVVCTFHLDRASSSSARDRYNDIAIGATNECAQARSLDRAPRNLLQGRKRISSEKCDYCLAMRFQASARRTNLLTNEHKGTRRRIATDKFINVGLLLERTGNLARCASGIYFIRQPLTANRTL